MTWTGTKDLDGYISEIRKVRGSVTLLPDPPPQDIWCPFISVDDHALEPPTLFQNRVPKALAGRVPQLHYGFDGNEEVPYWQIEDQQVPIGTGNGAAGRPMVEHNGAAQDFADFRVGVSDSKHRLADMDVVGMWASLCFPATIWGFAGKKFAKMSDPVVGLACVKAYNDWMIEEWCAADPDRFIPCQLPWLPDPSEASKEIYRNADRGFRSVSFSENPLALGFSSIHTGAWDPFFAACEETGTVVNLHVGSSGTVILPDPLSPGESQLALIPLNSVIASVDWVYSRIPIRFPNLKIVLSEGGASWVPMVKERLSRAHRRVDISAVWSIDDPTPVEVFERNFWFASIEDPSAFKNLADIGLDKIMLESDYPHSDGTWPETQQIMARDLNHLSDNEVLKVCVTNACDVYQVKPPPRERFERSVRGQKMVANH